MDDHQFAGRLAAEAGDALLGLRKRSLASGADLGAKGDRLAHEFLLAQLRHHRPSDAVLSEHGTAGTREPDGRVWIVDPLDGTVEYGDRERSDWAVHVALVDGGELTAGAIALPAKGKLYRTGDPPVVPGRGGQRVLVVSRGRPPVFAGAVAERLGAELRPMGSAGAKIAAVLAGEADAYVHAGGQYAWDSAAPVAVALAAGLHASRVDGTPLRYDGEDPWLPDLVVCRQELAAGVLGAVRADQAG